MISFTERFLGAESFTVTDSNYRSRTGQTVDRSKSLGKTYITCLFMLPCIIQKKKNFSISGLKKPKNKGQAYLIFRAKFKFS